MEDVREELRAGKHWKWNASFSPVQVGKDHLYQLVRAMGLKRGTLVSHPLYGLCSVGGYDRKKQTISLHNYRTNKRLTQGAKVKACRVLTWVAWRSWLVAKKGPKSNGMGDHPTPAPKQQRSASSFPVDESRDIQRRSSYDG